MKHPSQSRAFLRDVAEGVRKDTAVKEAGTVRDPEPQSMWRHVKTRGVYSVDGFCTIEATGERGVIYTAHANDSVWVRPLAEFMDGRFVPLEEDN